MNRTVGVTFRRTVGGGAILALGFAVVSVAPHELVPVVASTSSVSTVISVGASGPAFEETLSHVRPIALTRDAVAASATPSPVVRKLAMRPAATAAIVVPVHQNRSPNASAFAYGYCTWWVAHKRYVPWRGDAAQWWWNARAFGYAEGSVARVGAIMVMAAGGSASPQGHVAYVEKVNTNGTFVVSEMNWWGVPGGGWGRVDYRTVTSRSGILGFIY